MKYFVTVIMIALFGGFACAQEKVTPGGQFDYDLKNEKDPQFVLTDNYNTYLLTVLDVYGMMAGHEVAIRKFDQKNTLVNTFKYTFPKMEETTFYKYLGFAQGMGKVAVFIEGHSGKAGKSELYKLEFDKTTEKFSSTVLATNAIVSMSKSGDADLQKSDNGRFVAIVYTAHREKNQPEKNTVIVLDGGNLNVIWQKEVLFDDEFTSQNFAVTNSGRVVLVRDMKGSKKGITYLSVITATGQEQKTFEERIFLNEMRAVSIGAEEYLVAFNSDSKNFRSDFYNSLLLYDLKQGKILSNTKIREFSALHELSGVLIRKVMIQNNEIDIFAEALTEIRAKPTSGGFMNPAMLSPKYNFGSPYVFRMALDGQLKPALPIAASAYNEAYLHQSFGVLNVRGAYYINTGNYGGVVSLDPANPTAAARKAYGLPNNEGNYINQLFTYLPDSKSLIFARNTDNNQMSLVTISGVE